MFCPKASKSDDGRQAGAPAPRTASIDRVSVPTHPVRISSSSPRIQPASPSSCSRTRAFVLLPICLCPPSSSRDPPRRYPCLPCDGSPRPAAPGLRIRPSAPTTPRSQPPRARSAPSYGILPQTPHHGRPYKPYIIQDGHARPRLVPPRPPPPFAPGPNRRASG